MAATAHLLPPFVKPDSRGIAGLVPWLKTHRGAVAMAGLLSFAVPATFYPGAISAMREPAAADVAMLASWYVLYGAELWGLLLVLGYLLQHFRALGRFARGAILLLGASAAAALVELSTSGRARILIDQGVVQNSQTMHAYAFVSALIMGLLFLAHLQQSRVYEEAAARLASAQAAQLEARRRLVRARLQALQARIDPQLLFDLLEAVRRSYDEDASRAERLLDELVAFLRAALPRLRIESSSLLREAELTRAYVQLRALAGLKDVEMRLEVANDAIGARFPPGILLPLLDAALRAGTGECTLTAARAGGACRVVLTFPASPSEAAIARVRSVLTELYGSAAELGAAPANGAVSATIKVPYELA